MLRWITLVGLAGLVAAQEPSSFRVNTRLVEVDVVVRAKGAAVTGLTKDDFRILDNGKSQNIATFSVRSSAKKVASATPLPTGVISNRVDHSGEEPVAATVILLDRLNTDVTDQAYFSKEMLKYLKTMQPGEHVAVYTLLKSLRVVQDFTDDPERLRQIVSKAGAQQSVSLASSDESALKAFSTGVFNDADSSQISSDAIGAMEDAEKKNRALLTSAALEDIARHLRGLPGRKKLVWVSGGFPIGGLEVGGGAAQSRFGDEFGAETARAVKSLNNANIAVYAIDPRGLVASAGLMAGGHPAQGGGLGAVGLNAPNIAGMNLFASGTGGRAIYGTNDLVDAIKTVMEDDQVVYTIGFYPTEQKMDGSYHKISVKVARGGMEVHHRQGYLADDTKIYTPKQRREAMTDAVQNPLDSTELGLRATIAPISGRPGIYALSVTLSVNELHLEHIKDRWVGDIDFGTHYSPAVDFKGTYETIRISLTEARLRETLQNGFLLRRAIDSGGVSGDLRVVVQDRSTGTIGSVRIPIAGE